MLDLQSITQKFKAMKRENNNTNYLSTLLKYKLINFHTYLFRKRANQLNILTYKIKKDV